MLYSLGGLAKCYCRRIKCLIGPVGRDGVIRVSLKSSFCLVLSPIRTQKCSDDVGNVIPRSTSFVLV